MADPSWGDTTVATSSTFTHTGGTGCRGLWLNSELQGQNITDIRVTPEGGSARLATAFPGSPAGKSTIEAMNIAMMFIAGDEGELEGENTIEVLGTLTETYRGTVTSVIADGPVEINSSDASINSSSIAQPRATLPLNGRVSLVAGVIASGINNPANLGLLPNWTGLDGGDFGAQCAASLQYDTVGSADVTVGFDNLDGPQASGGDPVNDDAVAIFGSVAKVEAGGGSFQAAWARNSTILIQ